MTYLQEKRQSHLTIQNDLAVQMQQLYLNEKGNGEIFKSRLVCVEWVGIVKKKKINLNKRIEQEIK